ncbi:ARM repeat superfamily protein [Artemisia annua]|uniref:ARM repeat superfamily protein n=1 Tax=Artemisia annua TaxID=35608 RepID=A0A2U1M6E1_ARTAN|nr:ARM repeat superfamily protein [Artemisia annua]
MKIVEMGGAQKIVDMLSDAKDDAPRKEALNVIILLARVDEAVGELHSTGVVSAIMATPESMEDAEIEKHKRKLLKRFRYMNYEAIQHVHCKFLLNGCITPVNQEKLFVLGFEVRLIRVSRRQLMAVQRNEETDKVNTGCITPVNQEKLFVLGFEVYRFLNEETDNKTTLVKTGCIKLLKMVAPNITSYLLLFYIQLFVMGHLFDLHLSFQYVSRQLRAEWVPKILAKTCAKAIIDSTKRADTYLTAPSWMMTGNDFLITRKSWVVRTWPPNKKRYNQAKEWNHGVLINLCRCIIGLLHICLAASYFLKVSLKQHGGTFGGWCLQANIDVQDTQVFGQRLQLNAAYRKWERVA